MDENRELLWRHFELWVNLYKHYLELIVKFNVFHYAVTGAILSFYFSRTGEPSEPYIRYALVLPLLMNLALGILFAWASYLIGPMDEDVHALGRALGLQVVPAIKVLDWLLRIFAGLYLLIAVGVAALAIWFP